MQIENFQKQGLDAGKIGTMNGIDHTVDRQERESITKLIGTGTAGASQAMEHARVLPQLTIEDPSGRAGAEKSGGTSSGGERERSREPLATWRRREPNKTDSQGPDKTDSKTPPPSPGEKTKIDKPVPPEVERPEHCTTKPAPTTPRRGDHDRGNKPHGPEVGPGRVNDDTGIIYI